MEYKAVAKNIKMSPRKVRLVRDSVVGLPLETALRRLAIIHKRAATPMKKTLESARANAVNNEEVKAEGLTIKEIRVDEGITYKRYRFASRGRIAPYKKRTSHITVILEDNIKKTAPKPTPQKEVKASEVKTETEKKAKSKKTTAKKETKNKKEDK